MATDPDAGRAFNYETAEQLAETWASRRAQIEETCTPVREWMVTELKPFPGATVLELAAGVGDTGFEVSRQIDEEGRLLTTDFSPAMLATAARRGAELGVTNAEYRLIDAEKIDLDSNSVDGVMCRFGYMLMPDPAAALAETRRVLRPGGRVSLAVWGAMERNPFFTIIAIPLVQRGRIPPPEPPPAPGIFSMAAPDRTAALLSDAGFEHVRTEEIEVHFDVPSVDEYLAFIADTAGPMALAVRALQPTEREEIRGDVAEGLARYPAGDRYHLTGVVLCAMGE